MKVFIVLYDQTNSKSLDYDGHFACIDGAFNTFEDAKNFIFSKVDDVRNEISSRECRVGIHESDELDDESAQCYYIDAYYERNDKIIHEYHYWDIEETEVK